MAALSTLLIERRAFLLCGLAAMAAGPAAAALAPRSFTPQSGRLAFQVFRRGRKIGEHVLEFSGGPDAMTMRAHVEMAVGLGPVTLFRYRHQQTETWSGGRFASLQTDTTQNGARFHVDAERTDAGVRLEGTKGRTHVLAAAALPLTHWNRGSLGAPLFNPQDGKMMRLAITGQGPAQVMLASGRQISASRVVLAGETSIEDYYDGGSIWTGLLAKAKDGSTIEYRRA